MLRSYPFLHSLSCPIFVPVLFLPSARCPHSVNMAFCFQCVSNSEVGVVERLGKFTGLASPGLNCICWPLDVVGHHGRSTLTFLSVCGSSMNAIYLPTVAIFPRIQFIHRCVFQHLYGLVVLVPGHTKKAACRGIPCCHVSLRNFSEPGVVLGQACSPW